ncbi:hypothetical protein KP509_05G095500 [Ceratopteris richardii]|nr:hypothetical protein KP509_05G095500 [Ceratopteris richardii]
MPPASSSDCSNTIPSLSACVGFVLGMVTTPSATCCGNLSSVIQNQPQCLCQLFNTTLTDTLGINVTVAQQLPPKCKLQTPDPSLCELVGIPVPGPSSPLTDLSPTNAPSMSPGGPLPGPSSESVPSSPGSGSGGSGSSSGSNAPLTTILSVYTTLFLLSLSWILL